MKPGDLVTSKYTDCALWLYGTKKLYEPIRAINPGEILLIAEESSPCENDEAVILHLLDTKCGIVYANSMYAMLIDSESTTYEEFARMQIQLLQSRS